MAPILGEFNNTWTHHKLEALQLAWCQGDGSIHGSRRSPGAAKGSLLPSSCLGNPTDKGAWRAAVHGAAQTGHDWAHAGRPAPLPLQRWVCADPRVLCFRPAGQSLCSEQGSSAEAAPEEAERPDLESSDDTDHSSKVRYFHFHIPCLEPPKSHSWHITSAAVCGGKAPPWDGSVVTYERSLNRLCHPKDSRENKPTCGNIRQSSPLMN